MKNNFLNAVKEKTKARLKKMVIDMNELHKEAKHSRCPYNFLNIFSHENTKKMPACVIAEIKFASPANRNIALGKDCIDIANQYLLHGASALSIITEPEFFQGSLEYLKRIRAHLPKAYLLMKDFILDKIQLLQARIYGADAVLLIVAFLEKAQLEELYLTAISLGLTPLVEVHNENELAIAQSIGAKFIGINNRNLQTLEIDLSTSNKLIRAQKKEIFISESGLQSGKDIINLKKLGFSGFLIGSHFMRTENPGEALRKLLNEAHHENQN